MGKDALSKTIIGSRIPPTDKKVLLKVMINQKSTGSILLDEFSNKKGGGHDSQNFLPRINTIPCKPLRSLFNKNAFECFLSKDVNIVERGNQLRT